MPFRAAILPIVLIALAASFGLGRAQESQNSFTADQQRAIEQIVRDYLLRHPEVLLDASQELERKNEEAQKTAQAAALRQYREQLISPRGSTIAGNPNGTINVVEFFDYNCPYCRASVGNVEKLVAANPQVRLVLRELPVLGPSSVEATRVALAVAKETSDPALRSKYFLALMTMKSQVNGAVALATAEKLGLDAAKLQKDVAAPDVDAIIKENLRMADALGVTGTPTFVIGDQIIVGAVDLAQMEAALKSATE